MERNPYPRFKSKHNHRQRYKSKCVGTNIKVFENAVQLPKLGKVKCRISKEVKGRILSATVSKTPSGKYFVALCCTDVEIEHLSNTGAVTGLDMGIKSFTVDSEGKEYPNHRYLAKSE
ncbi:MAG: transposase, partial [Oscillospiraceae bacterium]|nr:transposase [Oscillospiraceae bacterium]